MRAVLITQPGPPEVLQVRDVAPPVPGPNQMRVRVHATSVNRADLLQRRGLYPAPEGAPQDIPGLEYAGTVESIGSHARTLPRSRAPRWELGDRVMGITGGGSYAEYVVVHEDEAIAIPDSLSFAQAAAVPEVFLTAYDALTARLHVQTGEWVLIHAVASGVGTAAAQLARAMGCRVIGTARSAWKLERIGALLDVAVAVPSEDFVAVARAATGGKGVDAIVDLVGGDYLPRNVQALATLGRIAVIGLVAGRSAPLDMGMLLSKRATIVGTALRSRSHDEKSALASAFAREVVPLLASGAVVPMIDRVMALADVAEAHRVIEANRTVGKIVLMIPSV